MAQGLYGTSKSGVGTEAVTGAVQRSPAVVRTLTGKPYLEAIDRLVLAFSVMPETSEQYHARLRSYIEGKDPLSMQQQAPAILAELINGVDEMAMRRSPAPGKWSVAEILAHLADDEIATAWRYRQIIEQNGITLSAFDQETWARIGDNASAKPADSLQLFRLLRESNLRLLRRLKPDQWELYGVHVERGRITIRDLVRHMAGHDINHIEQIRRIFAR